MESLLSSSGPLILVGIAVLLLVVALLLTSLRAAQAENRSLRSRLHGQSVRGGHVAESLAPLLADFPVDVGKPDTATVFLGQPVDYVYFDPEEGVSFVEVKSGRSGLSARQRKLRDLVEDGQVTWHTYRVE